jgi:hypothetical protein
MKSTKEEKTSTIPQTEILLKSPCFQMPQNIIRYGIHSPLTILPGAAAGFRLRAEPVLLALRKEKPWLDRNPVNRL